MSVHSDGFISPPTSKLWHHCLPGAPTHILYDFLVIRIKKCSSLSLWRVIKYLRWARWCGAYRGKWDTLPLQETKAQLGLDDLHAERGSNKVTSSTGIVQTIHARGLQFITCLRSTSSCQVLKQAPGTQEWMSSIPALPGANLKITIQQYSSYQVTSVEH